jgi:hypothetical protein
MLYNMEVRYIINSDENYLKDISGEIHNWLTNNRNSYKAIKWSDLIYNYSNPSECALIIPEESEQFLEGSKLQDLHYGYLPNEWFKPV